MTPIKRGTYRRLGLLPPQPQPAGILTLQADMSPEDVEDFRVRFEKALSDPRMRSFSQVDVEVRRVPQPIRRRWRWVR